MCYTGKPDVIEESVVCGWFVKRVCFIPCNLFEVDKPYSENLPHLARVVEEAIGLSDEQSVSSLLYGWQCKPPL
jgi:hypothetical protein